MRNIDCVLTFRFGRPALELTVGRAGPALGDSSSAPWRVSLQAGPVVGARGRALLSKLAVG
jgi:hypothetical protein